MADRKMEVTMTEPEPGAKTKEVFDYLKQCAQRMRTATYEEVAAATGLVAPGLGRPLNYIRDLCRRRSLPWLTAIVVNTRTWRPSASTSFLPDDIEKVCNERDKERLWRGMVLQVFAYDWSAVEFE